MERERNQEGDQVSDLSERGVTRRRFLGVLGAALVASCKPKKHPAAPSNQRPRPQIATPAPIVQPAEIPNTFQPAPAIERPYLRYGDWQGENMSLAEKAEAERRVAEFNARLQSLDQLIVRRWGIRYGLGDTHYYSVHELPPDPRYNPIRDIRDNLENLALTEQALVRQTVRESGIIEAFQAVSSDMFRLKDSASFDQALQVLAKGNCEGVALAAVSDYARAHRSRMILARDRFYYSARVRDYLPRGEDIYSQDIDPRNVPGLSQMFHERELAGLREHPGWAGARRQRQFRELAANDTIAELAKEADFTLAEYFSLIKAVIHQRERNVAAGNRETDVAIARRLVAAKRVFAAKRLLDSQTESVIVFHGSDHENWGGNRQIPGDHLGRDDDSWSRIAVAAGVHRNKLQHFGPNPERIGPSPLPNLYRAIRRSHGRTFIAFDSHGMPDYLEVDDRSPEVKITAADLARAFLDRVRTTQDPNTLEEVTFLMEACYTYDFAHNVIQEMQRQWEAEISSICPFANLKLPTIIVPVQEESYATHNFKAFRVLMKQLVGIRNDRGVTGKRILDNVEPISYREHDITFFSSGSGQVHEIAQAAQNREARVV